MNSPSIAIMSTFIVFFGAGFGGVVGGGVVGGGGGGGGLRYPQTLTCEILVPGALLCGTMCHKKQFSDGIFWSHATHFGSCEHCPPTGD